MPSEALTPEIIRGGETPARRFDPKSASPFVNKSVSEATRRAYNRALRKFFRFAGMKHPSEIIPNEVLLWRDRLRSQKKSAATVSFKLSVVRSFFEYLKAAGVVALNPASTKLVSPPELPSEPAGRALSAKEVRYLLSGPDRGKSEGARDYALMLMMLRLSLRVSEVCSLRASSVKWSHGRWTLRCKVKGGREEVWPLPKEVKEAIDNYLRLDRKPEGGLAFRRRARPPLPAAHELPDARFRQGALDTHDAEDRQAVGRLLKNRRPLAARPAQDGHHAGA